MSWLCLLAAYAQSEQDFLPPEQAFQFTAHLDSKGQLFVDYQIADKYYLYRDRFKFKIDGQLLSNEKIAWPKSEQIHDPFFDKQEFIYRHQVKIQLPVLVKQTTQLTVISQGCAEAGLCYTPMKSEKKIVPMNQADHFAAFGFASLSNGLNAQASDVSQFLAQKNLVFILSIFFLLGIALSLTPCVLPMIPIWSTVLKGADDKTSALKGFLLALSYTLGMALIYSALGIIAALLGEGLLFLQTPLARIGFALLMLGLALSMFGMYVLQLPISWQNYWQRLVPNQIKARYLFAFLMGAMAAIVVSPCVAPPLAGALIYVNQTHDWLLGASALFVMALGMGLPLCLLGASLGRWLPKAGIWMDVVKQFFGVLLLATAVLLIMPLISFDYARLAWALLFFVYSAFLLYQHKTKGVRLFATICLVLASWQIYAVWQIKSGDVQQEGASSLREKTSLTFERVHSLAQLQAILSAPQPRPVMLDFYADWCVACVEMERFTFSDAEVKKQLAGWRLLQVDLTANTEAHQELLRHFGLFGPPAILFFEQGQEQASKRVLGYRNAKNFVRHLQQL